MFDISDLDHRYTFGKQAAEAFMAQKIQHKGNKEVGTDQIRDFNNEISPLTLKTKIIDGQEPQDIIRTGDDRQHQSSDMNQEYQDNMQQLETSSGGMEFMNDVDQFKIGQSP